MRDTRRRAIRRRGAAHLGRALEALEARCLLASTTVSITVSGTAKWTDPGGPTQTHPIPLAYVEIRSSTEANTDPPLTTCQTKANGSFTATLDFDTTGGAQVFARIYARNPTADVKPNTGAGATTYSMDTQKVAVTAAGKVALPEKDGSNSVVAQQAFGILGATLQANTYAALLAGGTSAPAPLDVRFPIPATETTNFDSNTGQMFVEPGDSANWDVIEHEYGHYVAFANGFLSSSDAPSHNFGEPTAKPDGPGVAWDEGWADFFSISAQRNVRTAYSQGVPGVGDPSYTDNSVGINYNLATGRGTGELDEASVSSALYHLTVGDEGITVPDTALFRALVGSKTTTFGAVYDAIAAPMGGAQRSLLGHVLGLQKIAPVETAPADGAATKTTGIPTFKWTAPDPAGTDDFILQFYTSDYKSLLYQTKDLGDVFSYTPDAAAWSKIFQGHSTVKWFVEEKDTKTPVTPGSVTDQAYSGKTLDRYWSEARSLNGPSIGIVLDVTGSMQPEIDSVEAALVQYITNLQNSLAPDETPPTIDLVTFRDYPMETISSDDLDAVKSAIQAQVAEGGGDIPEPSAQSLEYAADNIGPGGTLLLITDAPSDPGTDLDGTIAQLRSRGDTVNAIISGDYGYGDEPTGSGVAAAAVRGGAAGSPGGTSVPPSAPTIGSLVSSAGAGQLPCNDAGDSPDTASPLILDDPAVHAFIGNQVQDPTGAAITNTEDYYAFHLVAGTSYNIPVLTDGGANVHAILFGTDGTTQVDSGSTTVGDPGFGALTLTYTPKTSGTYYLEIGSPTSATGYTVQVSDNPLVGAQSSVVLWTTVAAATGGEFLYRPAIESDQNNPAVVKDYEAAIVNVMDSTFEPTVLSAAPNSVPAGNTLVVNLKGTKTDWIQGNSAVAFSSPGITVDSVTVNSPTSLTVTVTVAPSAAVGFSSVTVTTKLGTTTEKAVGSNALQVAAAPTTPTLLEVVPGTLARDGTYSVRIIGTLTSWDSTSTLSLGPGVTITGTTVVSPTEITATATVGADASIGFRVATVTTADTSKTDTQDMAITLTAAPVTAIATVASLTPARAELGQHLAVAVVGQNTHFVEGETTAAFGPGVTVDSVTVTDATHATVTIDVNAGAAIGFRDVTLTTGAEAATQLDGFQVVPVPLSSPTITTDPVSQGVSAGQTVVFTAAASGNPAPTVRWQMSTDGGKTFADIDGATATTYRFTAAANQTGEEFRAVFTNSQGTTPTAAALLTVTTPTPTTPTPTTPTPTTPTPTPTTPPPRTAPTVLAGPDGVATTGAAFTRTGSFQDLRGTPPFTATVDYGDGSPVQPLALNGDGTFVLSHLYTSTGHFTVTVRVTDAAGLVGSGGFTMTVGLPSSGFGRARDAFIDSLYHDVLGRTPDPAGLRYWAGRLKHRLGRPSVVRLFLASKERQSLVKLHEAPRISYGRALADADRAAHTTGSS